MIVQKKFTLNIAMFFVVAFAMLFVLSSAVPANAEEFTLNGKIVSIDKDAKTLMIAPVGQDYIGATGVRSFALTHNANIVMANQKRDFSDLNVGDLVTVTYHQEPAGRIMADGIAINAPAGMHETAAGLSVSGRVVAINPSSVSIEPSYGSNYSGERERTFALRDSTLMMGRDQRSLRDIKTGDWVTINYHTDMNGNIIADNLSVTPAPGQAAQFSLSGKVVAVSASQITIDPSYFYGPNYTGPKGERTFGLMGEQSRNLGNLKPGDWVTINYHQESNGSIVADSVAITSPPATLPEERG